jgi:hypothetical protein
MKVNGQTRVVDVDPECPLFYELRDNLAFNDPPTQRYHPGPGTSAHVQWSPEFGLKMLGYDYCSKHTSQSWRKQMLPLV